MMRATAPLAPLIDMVERELERCYVCDRGPLEEMLEDLRRWARLLEDGDLEPASDGARRELGEVEFEAEPSTVVERPAYSPVSRRGATL